MYKVEQVGNRVGRETIVTKQGKRIGNASLRFVQWMHECVPKKQLGPEQAAMVNWYRQKAS